MLLADERATGDGEWAAAVRDWQDARIRKVVRRARGAEWRRAEALPGITVHGTDAQVRVFPPVPLDGWPKDLARLQVSGTHLDDPQEAEAPAPGGVVLWLNPELDMSAGKAMAQAGHGAQLAWWELTPAERTSWREAGFPSPYGPPHRTSGSGWSTTGCRWSGMRGSRRSRPVRARSSPTIRRCGRGSNRLPEAADTAEALRPCGGREGIGSRPVRAVRWCGRCIRC